MSKSVQLVKYIADAGICSRRDAAELVRAGKITINGHRITQPQVLVLPKDHVTYNGKPIKPVSKIYLILNKPVGYVTTHSDEKGRSNVFELIKQAKRMKLISVGRIDKDTSGLILITNDGDWAHRLMHPSFEVRKKYEVTLDRPLSPLAREQLVRGFKLFDGFVKADQVTASRYGKSIKITLHSGKNRIIRRMMEYLGYRVAALARVGFGGVSLKGLPLGKSRPLTRQELERLEISDAPEEKLST